VVSALDVLQIINYINANGSGRLPPPPPTGLRSFVDVNGDRDVTPYDVLTVINHINSQSSGLPEGEATPSRLLALATETLSVFPVLGTVSSRSEYDHFANSSWAVVAKDRLSDRAVRTTAQAAGDFGMPMVDWIPAAPYPRQGRGWHVDALGELVPVFAELDSVLPDIAEDIQSAWRDL